MSIYLYIALGVAAVVALACMVSLRLRAMSGSAAPEHDGARAASLRETERLYSVGLEGLRENEFERAARDLGLAAERGHVRAQLYFGLMRELGLGVQADLESARQWYRRAAAQGDADAYSRLRVLSDAQAIQQAAAHASGAAALLDGNVAERKESRAARTPDSVN